MHHIKIPPPSLASPPYESIGQLELYRRCKLVHCFCVCKPGGAEESETDRRLSVEGVLSDRRRQTGAEAVAGSLGEPRRVAGGDGCCSAAPEEVARSSQLAFLHSDEIEVKYQDFKTSNILLDSVLNELSLEFSPSMKSWCALIFWRLQVGFVQILISGLPGTADDKSDVYSFGVVLLQILNGNKAIVKNQPKVKQNLVDWAKFT
ncbi:protein kinase [Striga asiatica]|uniref:Protein kinase n=1 Tax=Striga asiatica TaxID=4170 RepID=A0A5A7QNA8_STRAF|nr:protein kinase [Striga asiatica]